MFERRIPEWVRHAPAPSVKGFASLAGLEAVVRGILISVFPVAMYDALKTLRGEMSSKCGVVRDAPGLGDLIETVETLRDKHGPARPLVTAGLMAHAALAREESRGGHYRSDFPETGEPERQFLLRDFKEAAEEIA